MSSLEQSEAEAAAVAVAPRVTLDQIKAAISQQYTFTAAEAVTAMGAPRPTDPSPDPLLVLTVCIMVMDNGFTVIGKSAPASPENFNRELGAKFAYEDCIRQLWPLMGFALRDALHHGAEVAAGRSVDLTVPHDVNPPVPTTEA